MRLSPILLISSVLLASSAFAQSPKAAAEATYNEGRRLMSENRYAEACAKFEESQRLDPGSGTQLNLAHCLEKLGKTASAWAEYKEAAAAARAAVEGARQELAEKGAAQLEPGLSKVRITAPSLPGLEVHLDGVVLGSGSLGIDLPVDPGDHTLEAVAPGYVPYKTALKIGAGGDKKAVTIPALTAAPKADTTVPVTSEPQTSSSWSTQRTAGVAVGAVGVAGVVVGAIFGANALSKNSAAQTHCFSSDSTRCDSEGIDLTSSSKTAATVSTIGLVIGGVGLVGGTILFLTAPSKAARGSGRSSPIEVRPLVGSRAGSLVLSGKW